MGSNEHEIGVVGTGIMGAGLAEVAAAAGFSVILKGRSQASADAAFAIIEWSMARQVKKEKRTPEEAAALLTRVRRTTSYHELAGAGIVIESVAENMDIKREVFAELDRVCAADTILATNTSTLPVTELAIATSRPGQVCGIHFFNPATLMELVEIVVPDVTTENTVARAAAFVSDCGKTPVRVKDVAGFVVNALLFPYLNNAVRMAEAGTATAADIDLAMQGGCNMPMGPLALLDLIGLDTAVSILGTLAKAFAEPNYEPVPLLTKMVENGHLGRKSGQGFFNYGD
ncbi:MAG: 3-hydroxybutyryl-CoA dehydrogenase [Acidimicrobiales bacterium]|nr:3-hydroxybutyryl-CoA dehydrogenase [Acidimicrobiales bacterium]